MYCCSAAGHVSCRFFSHFKTSPPMLTPDAGNSVAGFRGCRLEYFRAWLRAHVGSDQVATYPCCGVGGDSRFAHETVCPQLARLAGGGCAVPCTQPGLHANASRDQIPARSIESERHVLAVCDRVSWDQSLRWCCRRCGVA